MSAQQTPVDAEAKPARVKRHRSPGAARRDAEREKRSKAQKRPERSDSEEFLVIGPVKPTTAFERLSIGQSTLWVGNLKLREGMSEDEVRTHFRQCVNQSAEVEMRCVRGIPFKNAKDVPTWAEGANSKGARYAVLVFPWDGRSDEAPPSVQEINDGMVQIEHDMALLREVRAIANTAERKLERMREEKLPSAMDGERSEGQAPVSGIMERFWRG